MTIDNCQWLVYITDMVDNNNTEIYKEFMDLEAVATYLDVSISTVYRYVRDENNPLPIFKLTENTIRVKKPELDKWLEAYRKENVVLKESAK